MLRMCAMRSSRGNSSSSKGYRSSSRGHSSSSKGYRSLTQDHSSSSQGHSSLTPSNTNQNIRMTTRSISRAKKEEEEKNRLARESFIPFPGFHDYAMFFDDYKQMINSEREKSEKQERKERLERQERDNRKSNTFDYSGLFLLCLFAFIVYYYYQKFIRLIE